MKEVVIVSDQLYDWSDRLGLIGGIGTTQAASGVVATVTPTEGNLARLADRAIQALRQVGLQLHARAGTRSEVLLVCQPSRRATRDGVRDNGISGAGNCAGQQLSAGALCARRDLRDQSGTLATTRGARVEYHVVASQRGHWGCCDVGKQHGYGAFRVKRTEIGAALGRSRCESCGTVTQQRGTRGRS